LSVPLLSVDLDGNVSLRGSRNIKFLVNGKASSFFSSDVATALQMIPANEIKTVEIITSPGAKYDGEGDAGIVNIITKKSIIDGYNGTLNTMISTKMTRSSLNLNFGKGRFGLSARANHCIECSIIIS
jgi:outer membrane receptor for ferrienterochelin and colicin